jgi:hypothetical protein
LAGRLINRIVDSVAEGTTSSYPAPQKAVTSGMGDISAGVIRCHMLSSKCPDILIHFSSWRSTLNG